MITAAVRRSVLWPYPESWALVPIGAAWALLAAPALHDPGHVVLGTSHAHAPVEVVAHSAVMTVAMMVPLVLPQARFVARSSMWDRRHRATALFLAGYVAVWVAAGALLTVVASLVDARFAIGVALVAAVVVHRSPGRARRLRACATTVPLAPRGAAADRDCVRYGVVIARACVATCWAAMAVATASHGVAVMAAVFAVQLAERRRQR